MPSPSALLSPLWFYPLQHGLLLQTQKDIWSRSCSTVPSGNFSWPCRNLAKGTRPAGHTGTVRQWLDNAGNWEHRSWPLLHHPPRPFSFLFLLSSKPSFLPAHHLSFSPIHVVWLRLVLFFPVHHVSHRTTGQTLNQFLIVSLSRRLAFIRAKTKSIFEVAVKSAVKK